MPCLIRRAVNQPARLVIAVALVACGCGSTTNPSLATTPTASPASPAPSPTTTATPVSRPSSTPVVSPRPLRSGAWSVTGSMHDGRSYDATATVLLDGRVLVAGGEGSSGNTVATAELYDASTGIWTETGSMFAKRRGHAATLLSDGRVLVVGGWNLADRAGPPQYAELFDPATGTWTKTDPVTHRRYGATAVALPDGRALVLGGLIEAGGVTRGGEIFDPATASWRAIRAMNAPLVLAVPLVDGRVFVAHETRSAEIYDPGSNRWAPAQAPDDGAWGQAIRLADGEILLLDGQAGMADRSDPVVGRWTRVDVPKTGLGPAAVLTDGSVVVIGRTSSARFAPTSSSSTAVPRPPLPRDYALESADGVEVSLLLPLPDGRLLATEGGASALYDPNGGS